MDEEGEDKGSGSNETTEQTVERQEAEAGFAEGFKNISGAKKEEPKTDEPKVDEPKKEAPKVEAKVEPPAALTADEISALRGLPTQVRNLAGHIGGMKSQLQAAIEASKATAKTGADAPTPKQIENAATSTEKWKRMKEDFPEFADAMEERLAGQALDKQPPVDVEALKTEVTNEIRNSFATQLQETRDSARQFARVDIKYPSWNEDINTPEFKSWYAAQPAATQTLADSPLAVDALKLLDGYEAHRKKVAEDEAKRQRNEKRLTGAITPRGTSQPPSAADQSDEEAFEYGFKRARGT